MDFLVERRGAAEPDVILEELANTERNLRAAVSEPAPAVRSRKRASDAPSGRALRSRAEGPRALAARAPDAQQKRRESRLRR
jgi:hypothetical protein